MIKPIPGIQWAALVLTGQKQFPTYRGKRQHKEDFKKDYLDKELEKKKNNENWANRC